MKTLSHITFALLCTLAGGAHSQAVYRCGSSYSEQPCAGGTPVSASDARTTEQRSARERQVRQEAKTADAMEKARLKEEAAATRSAEQQARTEQHAAHKATAPKTRDGQTKNKLPAYRAPATPTPAK